MGPVMDWRQRNEETASTAVYPQTDQSPYTILLLQSALQPLVGFGLLYDFVPQSIYHTRIHILYLIACILHHMILTL